IIIAGYYSRSFDGSPGRIRRLVTGVALPYVVFETAYTFFTRWTDGVPDRPITLLEPLYLTWFLASLFVWRLTTPVWNLVRWAQRQRGTAEADVVPGVVVGVAAHHAGVAAGALAAAGGPRHRHAGHDVPLAGRGSRHPAHAAVPAVLRPRPVSAAGALPRGA